MALGRASLGTYGSSSNALAHTLSGIAMSTGDVLFVGVSSPVAVSGVTWNGISLTVVPSSSSILWYLPVFPGATGAIVVTLASSDRCAFFASQITGADPTPYDTSASASGTSANPSSGATPTTAYPDEILIGCVAYPAISLSVGGSWNGGFNSGQSVQSAGSPLSEVDEAYLIVSATQTATVSRSDLSTDTWTAAVATFRAISIPNGQGDTLYALLSQVTGTQSAIPHFDNFAGVVNSVVGDGYVCITIDNGFTDTFTKITGRVGFSYTPSEVWEVSNDGTSWSTFTATLANSYTPGGGAYTEVNQVWTPIAGSVTGRFIRYTLKDAVAASTDIATPGVIAQQANRPSLTGGSFSLSGTITLSQGQPVANATVSICYKAAATPEIRYCLLQNPASNGLYCADGNWSVDAVTTDCSGTWTWTGRADLVAVQIFLGPMRVNPSWDKESLGSTNGWPDFCYLITDSSVAEWANATFSDFAFIRSTPSGSLTGYHPGVLSASSFTDAMGGISCCGGPHGNGAQILSGILLYQIAGGYNSCNTTVFLNGSYVLDSVMDLGSPTVVFVAKAYGRYFDLNYGLSAIGLGATIGDSCSHSGAAVGGYFGEFEPPYSVAWWLINSVTSVTFNAGYDCSHLSAILTLPGYAMSAQGSRQIHPVNQLHTPVETPRIWAGDLVILVEDCTSSPDLQLISATTFDGALNVAWVSGTAPGALKTAVHLAPSKHIGASTVGWESTQTIEASGINGCGIVYMPDGRLVLVYDSSAAGKTRYNDQRGVGVAGDWSAAADSSPHYLSASGTGQEQAWMFQASGGGSVSPAQFRQCRDGKGLSWTAPVMAVASAVGPTCGGCWTGNQYGLFYTGAAGKIYFLATGDAATWPAGPGVDTGVTGIACGLARQKSGRLIGIYQASAGSAAGCVVSDDNGATWTAGGAPGVSPTPPPVVVADNVGTIYMVYLVSDAPMFVASVDGGDTWA